MPLVATPGTILMDGTEQNLFASQTTLQHYATWIFFHNLLANDSIEIRVYVNDQQSALERVYDFLEIPGPVDDPAVFFPFVPTNSYRVTAKQIAGTNRTITWQRLETA